jgi:hypothetical protein
MLQSNVSSRACRVCMEQHTPIIKTAQIHKQLLLVCFLGVGPTTHYIMFIPRGPRRSQTIDEGPHFHPAKSHQSQSHPTKDSLQALADTIKAVKVEGNRLDAHTSSPTRARNALGRSGAIVMGSSPNNIPGNLILPPLLLLHRFIPYNNVKLRMLEISMRTSH